MITCVSTQVQIRSKCFPEQRATFIRFTALPEHLGKGRQYFFVKKRQSTWWASGPREMVAGTMLEIVKIDCPFKAEGFLINYIVMAHVSSQEMVLNLKTMAHCWNSWLFPDKTEWLLK